MRPIDADELKKKSYKHTMVSQSQADYGFEYEWDCVDIEDLDDAPTIDAEPVRHGHWVKYTDNKRECYCSNCEYPAGLDAYGFHSMEDPYCRFCGAKMDGGENKYGDSFNTRNY